MKIRFAILGVAAASSLFFSCQKGDAIPSGQAELKTQLDSVSYAVGMSMGKQLAGSPLKDVNLLLVAKGVQDAIKDTPLMKEEQLMAVIQNFMMVESKKMGDENLEKGKKFLAENKKKEGVIELPSGIQYQILKEGDSQDTVAANKELTVHYHGTNIEGKVFDSSVERGTPFVVQDLTRVIPGWLVLQGMKVGTKCKLFIPADKAYGPNGAGSIGPNETLIFEVEILAVKDQQAQE